MITLKLNNNQQVSIANAFGMLDSYESVTPGVEKGPKSVRVPFKLGAARKVLVKNINTLKAAIQTTEEARQAIFKEYFADVAPDADGEIRVSQKDYPEQFPLYAAEFAKLMSVEESFDLLPLPEAVAYGDNDFPTAAIALLDEHGLIA